VVLVEQLDMLVVGMEQVEEVERLTDRRRGFLPLVYVLARAGSHCVKVQPGCSFSIAAS
jgi:hypothetical protein